MALFSYLREGELTEIQKLISQSPELVNQTDSRGFTPLIMATYFGRLDVAQILIDAGADLDAQDASGNTALMGVCFKGDVTLVNLLIDAGANLDISNNEGSTAASYTIAFAKLDILSLLIEKGADVSDPMLLQHAKTQENAEMISLLENAIPADH